MRVNKTFIEKHSINHYKGRLFSRSGWFERSLLPVLVVNYNPGGRTKKEALKKIAELVNKYPVDSSMKNFSWTEAEKCE